MDKEFLLRDFFKSLRVALNNSGVYFSGHPLLVKSVEDLRTKICSVNQVVDPFVVGIAPDALFVDQTLWQDEKNLRELAEHFHRRKVKSLEIKSGITLQELTSFLVKAAMTPSDIMKSGGLSALMVEAGVNGVIVNDLDYSQFLLGGKMTGKDGIDVWTHLLGQSTQGYDSGSINELADNFGECIAGLSAADLLANEQLKDNIRKFIIYLKDNKDERFHKCTRDLARMILRDRTSPADGMDKLRVMFSGLSNDDIADALMREITDEENFNPSGFNIFSRLIENESHERIAANLAERIRKDSKFKSSVLVAKKIKDLMSVDVSPSISRIYANTFADMAAGQSSSAPVFINRDSVFRNYAYALLNLFILENHYHRQAVLMERAIKDWDKIVSLAGKDYLRLLAQALNDKSATDVRLDPAFAELQKRLAYFVESQIMSGQDYGSFVFFLDILERSALGSDDYLDRIFNSDKLEPAIVRLFFKFFPSYGNFFIERVKIKLADAAFMRSMIEVLRVVDSRLSLSMLQNIFALTNNVLKVEALRAMQDMLTRDSDFILEVVRTGDVFCRREALVAILRDDPGRMRAARMLLDIKNPFGVKNKLLLENIKFVGDLDLVEAGELLSGIAASRFFWHGQIRAAAAAVLAQWGQKDAGEK